MYEREVEQLAVISSRHFVFGGPTNRDLLGVNGAESAGAGAAQVRGYLARIETVDMLHFAGKTTNIELHCVSMCLVYACVDVYFTS